MTNTDGRTRTGAVAMGMERRIRTEVLVRRLNWCHLMIFWVWAEREYEKFQQ